MGHPGSGKPHPVAQNATRMGHPRCGLVVENGENLLGRGGARESLVFIGAKRMKKNEKWIKYREAWELLRVLEIQACVDPLTAEWGRSEFAELKALFEERLLF